MCEIDLDVLEIDLDAEEIELDALLRTFWKQWFWTY